MGTITGKKINDKSVIQSIAHFWYKYQFFVKIITSEKIQIEENNINYWRGKLFTKFITYLLPICFIALVPGVVMAIKDRYYVIALFDTIAVCGIAAICLNKNLNLDFRKFCVFFILYCLATLLMFYLGSFGPGNLYLLAIVVMITFIFPTAIAYWSIVINLLICSGFGIILYLRLYNIPAAHEYTLGSWIAVSSNLIFLSWVSVLLISNTLKGLEKTIIKEFYLKDELQKEAAEKIVNIQLLKESEGHYKSLFFLNPAPMWVLDGKTLQFLQVNESAIKNYGYTCAEFLTMTINDIKLDKDRKTLQKDLQKNLKTKTSLRIVTQHRKKNRERFFAEVIFDSINFKGQEAILTIAQDISEQVNYIKAIENQNNQLREIAHIQSHDVRAPLARIMGLANLIAENEKTDPEILEYLIQSTNELDDVIKAITKNTENIQH